MSKGHEARAKFVASQISKGIAFQIRSLRNRTHLSQPKLAELVGTTQNQVYRLENPSIAKPTITTLKKVAAAFDVALVVRFEPFSQLVNWLSATPHLDPGLTSGTLEVPDFETELRTGVFNDSEQVDGHTNALHLLGKIPNEDPERNSPEQQEELDEWGPFQGKSSGAASELTRTQPAA
ncbi:MAG: helix-turn-helix transcriptional regulator [Terriglobia bacterium]